MNRLLATHNPVSSEYIIILDGYDEIASDNVGAFNSQLNAIKNKLQTAHIVVSSRLNFYRYQSTEHGNFDGFKAYLFIPLKDSDKQDYALAHGIINYQQFSDAVLRNSLQSLYENPFYFVEMIKYWKSAHMLPGRVEFMQCIIRKIIENDIYKYDDHRQKKIDDEIQRIRKALENTAFIMQCMHCTELSNEDYLKILPSLEIRELLKHIGLWSRNGKEYWEFKHNNFREFFAASYLDRMNLNEILQYTTMRGTPTVIRPSWMNTFSYLALIRKNNDLVVWIQRNNPALIVRFEKDRLKETDRLLAFQAILDKHENAGTWLQNDSVPIPELVAFAESRDSVKYLLAKIASQEKNYRHTLNLLRVLKAFTSLHGMESETHVILLGFACKIERPLAIRIEAIKTMSDQNFFDPQDIAQLVAQYGHAASEPEILITLYRYLINSGSCEKYIELLLWGRENIGYQEELRFGLNRVLYTGLKCANSIESLSSIFTFFCRNPSELDSHYGKEDNELYEACYKKAVQLYTDKSKPFIDCLCASLRQFSEHGVNLGINSIKEFMISTHTEEVFLSAILSWPENEQLLPTEDMMCDGIARLLVEKYLQGTINNKELIPWLVRRLKKIDPWFSLFDDAMLRVTGHGIPPQRDYSDMQQKRKEGYQRYFASLFDAEVFNDIVKQIVAIIGEDVHVCEVNAYRRDHDELYHETDLSTCVVALHNFLYDTATIKFSEYQNASNWDWESFSLQGIHQMLTSHKNDLLISDEQKTMLKARCVDELYKHGFPDIATDKGGRVTCDSNAFSALQILSTLNILCTQEQLLQMSMIPVCLFAEQKHKGFPDYITENVDVVVLQGRVLENINNKGLHGTVACSHIEYCAEHQLREAKQLAIQYILSEDDGDTYKSTTIQYIYDLFGIEGIYDYILPHCQSERLLQLITGTIPQKDYSPELIAEISRAYQKRNSQTSDYWFTLLLQLNNKEALSEYYQKAKASMSIPDHYDNNRIGDITEAIATIKGIHLLDVLLQLLELSYSDGFIDNEGPWSLKSNAIKAIENIGVENYQVVNRRLEEKKKEHKGNQTVHLILIDMIERIKTNHEILTDEPLTLEEACSLQAVV